MRAVRFADECSKWTRVPVEFPTCERCAVVGRSVGESKVRAMRIVNFFGCSRCRSGQLKCRLLQVSRALLRRNPPARLVAALETSSVRQRTQDRQSRTQP